MGYSSLSHRGDSVKSQLNSFLSIFMFGGGGGDGLLAFHKGLNYCFYVTEYMPSSLHHLVMRQKK